MTKETAGKPGDTDDRRRDRDGLKENKTTKPEIKDPENDTKCLESKGYSRKRTPLLHKGCPPPVLGVTHYKEI